MTAHYERCCVFESCTMKTENIILTYRHITFVGDLKKSIKNP